MTTSITTRRQIEELLTTSYPNGMTAPEIAEHIGVTRQTARNHIKALEVEGLPIEEGLSQYHYTLHPKALISPINLTIAQTWVLYLPLRRMVRARQNQSLAVQVLLQQIASSLDPTVGTYLVPDIGTAPVKDDILRILAESWRNETYVEIDYKPPNTAASRHLIAPYWFEPAVWSDSAYVICDLMQKSGNLIAATLKIDRIQSAIPRQESFTRSDPERIIAALEQTWGIWMGDDPVEVSLQFANRVRQRLLETHWHSTQRITDMADGSVLWQALIAEPQEMLPWIRGWGSDVEVLAPDNIREQIGIDADRTARKYGWCDGDDDSFLGLRKKK